VNQLVWRGSQTTAPGHTLRRFSKKTSATARSNAASLALDGWVDPLTLRTYWSAAASTSSGVAAGSKLWSTLMFLHISAS